MLDQRGSPPSSKHVHATDAKAYAGTTRRRLECGDTVGIDTQLKRTIVDDGRTAKHDTEADCGTTAL